MHGTMNIKLQIDCYLLLVLADSATWSNIIRLLFLIWLMFYFMKFKT